MKTNTPEVTVLTPVYNGLPHLKESIESTLNQSYKDFVFLIIDDASPDPEVLECIKSYKDPRIKLVVNEENLGVSRTINKALEIIDTPYVVRSDQDDVNLPNRVEEQIKFLKENENISIICSWEHTIDSEGNFGKDWKRKLRNYGEFLGPVLLGICPIWHPSISFKTQDMIDAGGFKVDYVRAEDFEVTARLAAKRYEASILPKFHLLQRQHEASQSKEFENEQANMSNKIQEEVLEKFINREEVKELAAFLRLEKPEQKTFDKVHILKVSCLLDKLLKKVSSQQKLRKIELNSLKNVIYKRVGWGILFAEQIKFLPSFLFMFIFYSLSPQFIKKLRDTLKKIYNSVF